MIPMICIIVSFIIGGIFGIAIMAIMNIAEIAWTIIIDIIQRKEECVVNNTLDTTKWLVIDSDTYRSHVKYSEIAAFTYGEDDKRIRIYLKGNNTPLVFGFNNLGDLRFAYETISNNLSIGGDKA